MYRRVVARPRMFWDNGRGRSLLVAAGGMAERAARRHDARRVAAGWPAVCGEPRHHTIRRRSGRDGLPPPTVWCSPLVEAPRRRITRTRLVRFVERDRHQHAVRGGVGDAEPRAGMPGWLARRCSARAMTRGPCRVSTIRTRCPASSCRTSSPPRSGSRFQRAPVWMATAEFGTFVSPRVSVLLRPSPPWAIRLSGGRGYFAPTPFTEETEATGLSRLAPLGALDAERADNFSADVTWARAPFEMTVTLFYSRIDGALAVRRDRTGRFSDRDRQRRRADPIDAGTEFIARRHVEGVDLIMTHMYLWSTEPAPDGTGVGKRRSIHGTPPHSICCGKSARRASASRCSIPAAKRSRTIPIVIAGFRMYCSAG